MVHHFNQERFLGASSATADNASPERVVVFSPVIDHSITPGALLPYTCLARPCSSRRRDRSNGDGMCRMPSNFVSRHRSTPVKIPTLNHHTCPSILFP